MSAELIINVSVRLGVSEPAVSLDDLRVENIFGKDPEETLEELQEHLEENMPQYYADAEKILDRRET